MNASIGQHKKYQVQPYGISPPVRPRNEFRTSFRGLSHSHLESDQNGNATTITRILRLTLDQPAQADKQGSYRNDASTIVTQSPLPSIAVNGSHFEHATATIGLSR